MKLILYAATLTLLFASYMYYEFIIPPYASAACLHRGYPSNHVAYGFRIYCERRVNETNEVIKLSELKRREREAVK